MSGAHPPVSFPTTDPIPAQPKPHLRPPHLPFRRISLPTAPSLAHRQSVVSVASFDSLPEESPVQPSSPGLMGLSSSPKRAKDRPTSMDLRKVNNHKKRIIDEAKEAKRRKVILEFYETEKAYVDGLELIYSHFLTPIIASLDTANPLLDRTAMTSVFSNFIDIWNLHRSFYSSLRTLLDNKLINPPPLSPILLSHFPYLSLYTPFVTSFPDVLSSISNLTALSSSNYNPQFATFLKAQEADPRCAKLNFRDWLLTIVQRCPRYLLLLKDLIQCTGPDDPEHTQLTAVHTLVSKITLSLNTSLHTHAQTLALLALQRATPNLPFQLIEPGRTLLKRGALIQLEQRSSQPREREFLLFSDRLIWLASEELERGGSVWRADWWANQACTPPPSSPAVFSPESPQSPSPFSPVPQRVAELASSRPPMIRSRSKSDAELPTLKAEAISADQFSPPPTPGEGSAFPDQPSPTKPLSKSAVLPLQSRGQRHRSPAASPSPVRIPRIRKIKRHASTGAGVGEERWVYKGKAEVVDLQVVVMPSNFEDEGERRLEILSPEGSFVLYASCEEERDEWASVIRQAKAQLLVSLNITHPNTTLTSSSSTNHLRHALQALPFPPSDERLDTIKMKASEKKGKKRERRGKVEHWVPAIWIPDGKTEGCMRCGRTFGWRRRRHHCRLCGRCVCAGCSGRVFFINDPNSKNTKPARSCDACYETVFPLLDSSGDSPPEDTPQPTASTSMPSPLQGDDSYSTVDANNTIHFLSTFPAWLSMPSLPLPQSPQALMALDRGRDNDRSDRVERVRVRSPPSRPRSYVQILEDFEDMSGSANSGGQRSLDTIPALGEEELDGANAWGSARNGNADAGSGNVSSSGETVRDDRTIGGDSASSTSSYRSSLASSKRHTMMSVTPSASPTSATGARKEDTARRNKRLSMPAVALHTTVVTARTRSGQASASGGGDAGAGRVPPSKSKRFSLVLGTGAGGGRAGRMTRSEVTSKNGPSVHSPSPPPHPPPAMTNKLRKNGGALLADKATLGRGEAAEKLNELLARGISGQS